MLQGCERLGMILHTTESDGKLGGALERGYFGSMEEQPSG